MKKMVGAVLVLLGAAACAPNQPKQSDLPVAAASPVAGAVQSRFPTEAVPSDGNYTMQMPRGFKRTTTPERDGGTLQQFIFTWKEQNGPENAIDFGVYNIALDQPDRPLIDASFQLKAAQSNVQGRFPGAVVLQQADTQLGPAQGRSFTLSIDQGKRLVLVKCYYINSRLYEVIASVTPEQQNGPVVTNFMNSLSILR